MNFVNAFQKIALSLGVLFFGIGVFIYSISPAQADNPTVTNNVGKIIVDQVAFVQNGQAYYYALFLDTETGKSKLYYFNNSTSTLKPTTYQFPTSPLY